MDNHKNKVFKLVIDFPIEKFSFLKTLADQMGISEQQYVVDLVCDNLEKELELRKIKFIEAKEKVLNEKDGALKKLANS